MIDLGPTQEDDVVRAFVLAELESPAHSKEYGDTLEQLGVTREYFTASISTDEGMQIARILLGAIRGYRQNHNVLRGFPTDVSWRRVELVQEDLHLLKYVRDCPPWDVLSNRTRRVSDGARSVHASAALEWPFDAVRAMAAQIRDGVVFRELIAVSDLAGGLVLVEGHTRATAYLLAKVDRDVPAFIGTSPSIATWAFL
jgi:hypothetical protein